MNKVKPIEPPEPIGPARPALSPLGEEARERLFAYARALGDTYHKETEAVRTGAPLPFTYRSPFETELLGIKSRFYAEAGTGEPVSLLYPKYLQLAIEQADRSDYAELRKHYPNDEATYKNPVMAHKITPFRDNAIYDIREAAREILKFTREPYELPPDPRHT